MLQANVIRRILMIAGISILGVIVFSQASYGQAQPHARQNITTEPVVPLSNLTAFAGDPAYDSGWFIIGPRPDPLPIPFTHNLGGDTDNYFISLECKDDTTLAIYDCTSFNFSARAHWYALTDTSISVWIAGGTVPDEVRVRIYTLTPDFDSDWRVLLARPDPIPLDINHSRGGNPDDYLVSLECKDDTTLATYDCTDHNFSVNAHWYDLTATTIRLWIQSSPRPDEVRVRLFHVDPDYDSGWLSIGPRPDPLPVPLTHNLDGDPDDYLVDLQCKDNTLLATYDCANNQFIINVLWFDLTNTSTNVWVPGSSQPDEIRVRILTPKNVYLPVIKKY